jgi:hypothetical protein
MACLYKIEALKRRRGCGVCKVGGIVSNKDWRGYVHGNVGLVGLSWLFAIDVGASQTAEEGELESVKSLS